MNTLKLLEDFRRAIADYKISTEGKQVLADARLVLCSAATATGRNTIIRELVKTDKYYFIVSDTTRKPRINDGKMEQSGVEYWFRTEAEMLSDIKSGKFVEAEIIHNQQVSGMSIREIEKANQQAKIAITDADRGGVAMVRAVKPDTICIFFLPPDYDSWQQRINSRGNMDPAEYERRMATAREEIQNALDQDYYHFLINDDIGRAIKGVQKIANGDIDPVHEAHGLQVAQSLLDKLN